MALGQGGGVEREEENHEMNIGGEGIATMLGGKLFA
jgi:hypothetical protein